MTTHGSNAGIAAGVRWNLSRSLRKRRRPAHRFGPQTRLSKVVTLPSRASYRGPGWPSSPHSDLAKRHRRTLETLQDTNRAGGSRTTGNCSLPPTPPTPRHGALLQHVCKRTRHRNQAPLCSSSSSSGSPWTPNVADPRARRHPSSPGAGITCPGEHAALQAPRSRSEAGRAYPRPRPRTPGRNAFSPGSSTSCMADDEDSTSRSHGETRQPRRGRGRSLSSMHPDRDTRAAESRGSHSRRA